MKAPGQILNFLVDNYTLRWNDNITLEILKLQELKLFHSKLIKAPNPIDESTQPTPSSPTPTIPPKKS